MLAGCLGWLGTAGTFVAYGLLWRGRLSADSWKYAALNAAGGLLGGIGSALYGAWPSTASCLTWAAVGLHALLGEVRWPRSRRGQTVRPEHVPVVVRCAEVTRS